VKTFFGAMILMTMILGLIVFGVTRGSYSDFSLGGKIYPRYWQDPRTEICFAWIAGKGVGISFTSVDCTLAAKYLED